MKKLGIIGGAGPLASALFYESCIHESYLQVKRLPEIFLYNYSFCRGLTLEEAKENGNRLQDELQTAIEILKRNSADFGVIACNTLHLYLDNLQQRGIAFFHIPELLIEAAVAEKRYQLLILGTENTCNSNLYRHPLITTIYPSKKEQKVVDHVIDRVLEGKILQEDALLIRELIVDIARRDSIDAVVLGCTDLPVLHDRFPISSPKPIYDSIKLSAKIIMRCL